MIKSKNITKQITNGRFDGGKTGVFYPDPAEQVQGGISGKFRINRVDERLE